MKSYSRKWLKLLAIGATGTISCMSFVLPASAATTNVNVVGYSVVGPAYKALEAAFQATPAGQNVTFTNSFGASDTETNNVVNGQAADIVNLSYESNIATLVNDNLVPTNWTSQESSVAGVRTALTGKRQQTTYNTPGIVTDSTVVFIVRAGNPPRRQQRTRRWRQVASRSGSRSQRPRRAGPRLPHSPRIVRDSPQREGRPRPGVILVGPPGWCTPCERAHRDRTVCAVDKP